MQFARKALGVSAVTAVAATLWVGLAAPASAHNKTWTAACDTKTGKTTVSVDLTYYNADKANTVELKDNDTELVAVTNFPDSFKTDKTVAGDVAHTFTLTVKAWDDTDGKKGFSFTQKQTVPACVKPTSSSVAPTSSSVAPSSSAVVAPPSSNAPSSSATSVTTSPAAVAAATENPLANTGASVTLPLLLGGGLLAAGAVALFAVRRTRRNSGQ
ncbi:LPXTG cell wall anchor domain-containing protein [Solihabitans fulvus]|nr:LPXTG cell wall anchor domain-containing protein [Solihabitans fulvus]